MFHSPIASTTPPGSPPKHLQQALGMSAVAAQPVASDKNTSILEALANLARQNNALPPVSSQPQGNPYNVSHTQNNPTFPSVQNSYAIPPQVNVPTPAAPFAPQPHVPAIPNYASSQPNPYAAVPPVVAAPSLDPAMQQQYTLIKALADSGMPPDEISRVLAGAFSQPPPQYQHQHQNHTAPNADNGWGSRPDESRDRNGYPDREAVRSPQDRYRQRSRSRSPARGWNGQNSPAGHRRNDSNLDYADRDRNSPGRNRGDGRGRGRGGGSEYRQRSPPRRGHSLSPSHSGNGGEKWVAYDPTIGKGNIKGMSLLTQNNSLNPTNTC
jgi:protein NRD1